MFARLALIAVGLVACKDPPPEDAMCRCTPGNVSSTKRLHEAAPMDGAALVAALRQHQRDVNAGKNARAIKIADDELRNSMLDFCQPCTDWVKDRMTIDDMFPMRRLDEAVRGVCMGLVLRDGTTVYGDARPRACR